ncbi:hypothetical protein HBI56_142170 [Parastagonospora nodorum]|uniref:Uncharacterized protein n=1 Tax=Phaeosphaeria nodorum (strain SN15 / ATCC MYA-4574 / FGSC 10173) TaxID=321614 RepID=A0A7U2F7F0_PHANO|nr:hypothetical protein HBH56_034900 [Parastagonospora nodorum]QRD00134.1 hypothetical protein JI435_070360 [Parastagonospora nodorum SN15]KAH3934040.1 hypothetical protein HBH54_064550 [Parastagonospora nodorum]KAH3952376.1 hypothetical protein HBH53_045530 [Parastagonospora nodorum]KAH3979510.1 hypothetical protein HBH51_056540 [Parastagonospora nodorum]
MSHESHPITLTRFASALSELPIDAIYGKYAELRNNIAHMESSNKQLEDFARENDDRECYEALMENKMVIKRFEERIEALKREVTEVRGLVWRIEGEEEVNPSAGVAANGEPNGAQAREERNGTGARDGGDEDGVFL